VFRSWFQRKKSTNDAAQSSYRNGNEHLIELHQVVKTFETAAGPFMALKGIDLQVDSGEFVAVVGKSGSGKSTLINMITGIDRPTSGEVLIGHTAVHTLKEGQMAVWRGRNIGVVFQFFQLLPTLTVVENIMLPMDFCNLYSARERQKRAMQLLDQMEMADQADKLPNAISGGQQQRVAIARALANDPPIIVADEPTGNLDSQTAESVIHLFEGLVDAGKTILMVTHDADLARRVTRTVIISDGEVIEEYLARTFPALTEPQLIQTTRKLTQQEVEPGATILRQGDLPDKFYIVIKGEVEVVLHPEHAPELVVSRLKRGQYFGEVELLAGGENLATVRADSRTGATVATLDQETFNEILAESEETRTEVGQVVQERILENVTKQEEANHG